MQQECQPIWLLCGQLFDAVDGQVQKNQAILVEEGKIAQILPADKLPRDRAAVVDLSDRFVMPGLIDAHVHTVLDAVPLASQNFARNSFGYYAFLSLQNAQTDLMAGFTSLRDEASYGYVDVALRDAIRRGQVWGPRMLVSGAGIGATGGHGDSHYNPYTTGYNSFCIICDSPDECRKAARTIFKYGADQLKLIGTGGVGSIGDEPGIAELTYEEMKAAIDVARVKGKGSSVHAHGAQGIKNAIRAGITSVEHGSLMDEEGIELMLQNGVYLVPTLAASHAVASQKDPSAMPAENLAKSQKVEAQRAQTLAECLRRGVKIAFGTDAGTPFNRHGSQGVEFGLMVQAGFTPTQALLAATRHAADLMGWQQQVGTLQPGKWADIVAFAQNPLEEIHTMEHCTFVMKGGVIYKNLRP